jgi:ketosteroid isomerase-like protein
MTNALVGAASTHRALCAGRQTDMAGAAEPVVVVREYIDAFNRGDMKTMVATCADQVSILDGLAPHVWQGPTACEDWYRDVIAAGRREGAEGYFVTPDKPWHVDVTGDCAYVVVPTTMTFSVHGKRVTQSGSVFTVALRKLPEGWRIMSWAWTKGSQKQ